MSIIYFLGGLPRSGNTLLSAILNQNPSVYCSPISPLLDNLVALKAQNNIENNLIADFSSNLEQAMKTYATGFYQNCGKPIILDRNKGWGSKESMMFAYQFMPNQPKIVFTVRDIPSILASFISLVGNEPVSYLDNQIRQYGIRPYGKQTQDDLRCDLLMSIQIGNCLATLDEAIKIQAPIHLVEYDDLVSKPQEILDGVYDFLEIDKWTHDFNSVKKLEVETLDVAGLPSNLHDVRPQVNKKSSDPKDVLSELSLRKYSDLEFWR
jgi:sulfotransferase